MRFSTIAYSLGVVLLLTLIQTPAQIVGEPADGLVGLYNDRSRTKQFILHGVGHVSVNESTLDRMTGLLPAGFKQQDETVSIVWEKARLESQGIPPLIVRLKIQVNVGHTMEARNALFTKIEDARGEMVALDPLGPNLELRLSERGSWTGKFINTMDSSLSRISGSDHLALELPFTLFDQKSGRPVRGPYSAKPS